jgi:alkylation response protein AidB-like acyl-CoA dehydrogenase
MTDFPLYALSEEHQAIREAVRAVAEAKIAPFAAAVDEEARYPEEAAKALLAADFHAPHVPEEYGGAGADALATVLVIEEVARVCVSSSLIPAVNKLGSLPVQISGSEELKKKYLSALAAGEGGFFYCLSEPDAGSDAIGMKCKAVRDGDSWVLNGVKRWITNAGESEYYTVMAVTDPEARSKGISAFVVEKSDEGVSFGAPEKKLGIKGSPTRGLLRQRAHSGGSDDRRGGHRVLDGDEDPRPHPRDHRGPGGRGRAGCLGLCTGLRQGAPAVRQGDR